MRQERLEVLQNNETEHFWFRARRTIVDDACRQLVLPDDPRVVDVGCGTGYLLSTLFPGRSAVGVDLLATRTSIAATSGSRVRGSVETLPIASGAADLVLALDVLEHVDDVVALQEVRRVLTPRGFLVATVPALQALWSHRDTDAGHLRRYSRGSVCAAFANAGFEIERCSYFHGALLPVLALSRVIGRRGPMVRDIEDQPPGAINRLFGAITEVEARLAIRGLRPPLGSSLIVVARRQ